MKGLAVNGYRPNSVQKINILLISLYFTFSF